MLKHTPCSQGFLTEQCRRRLDRQNDSAGGIDRGSALGAVADKTNSIWLVRQAVGMEYAGLLGSNVRLDHGQLGEAPIVDKKVWF
jgi:hypothetical protein